MVTISADSTEAVIDAGLGGSLLAFSVDGSDLVRRSLGATDPKSTACFPMVPWVNRINRGKFATSEAIHSVPPNTEEPHPLHGHGWLTPWKTDSETDSSVTLRFDHEDHVWPWPYTSFLRYIVEPGRLIVDLEVTNRGDTPMPASIGFHPYFDRPARISATVDGRWMTDETLIPSGWEDTESFRLTPVDGLDCDNTYTGWDGRAYVDSDHGRIEVSSDTKRLHLYAPRWGSFFALEPVSASPDAFNHPDRGATLLNPGETLHHWMRLNFDST